MKPKFSKTWNRSKQTRKQRKYRANAPLHIKGKFLNAHLSKELKEKYGTRNVRLRTGDKVKVLRGQYKGEEQKVERINIKQGRVFLEKIEFTKAEGSKTTMPFQPSNLMIIDLNMDDKKRIQKIKGEE